jgi:hypothetical protein
MAKQKKSGLFKAKVSRLPFVNNIANVANIYYGNRNGNSQMIEFGRRMRDEHLSKFPILGGAVQTYQTLSANREYRVSGKPREANAALRFLQNTRTITYDGIEEYGMYQFLQRVAIDSVTIGRFMYTWDKQGMEYLDPAYMNYDMEKNYWYDRWLGREIKYPHEMIDLNHTIPTGRSGHFVSPLLNVLPSAILDWLIREHDMASADGRKIRDIKIVLGEDVAEQIADAIESRVAEYSGASPEEHAVEVVWIDDTEGKRSAQDIVATLGLSSIPDTLDRNKYKFSYVNEIGNALGLTIRQFWNAEEATNRALEQVQQERQLARGPGNFARVIQRGINRGPIRQFGGSVKMSFYEEIDAATKKSDAEVIKLYSEALQSFAKTFNGNVNGEAFLSWLQSKDILPPDLDLITDLGTMTASDTVSTPQDGERIQTSDITATPGLQNGSGDKSLLGYGEITLDQDGLIVDSRRKIYSFKDVMIQDVIEDDTIDTRYNVKRPTFTSMLAKAREKNLAKYREKSSVIKSSIKNSIPEKDDELEDRHHRLISDLIMSEPELFEEVV